MTPYEQTIPSSTTGKRGLVPAVAAAILGSTMLFLLADALDRRIPDWASLWEALRTLALALLPAVLVALYDHYRTIKEVSVLVAERIEKSLDSLIPARSKFGLVKFHERLDFPQLFRDLESDDELLWLDTYCPRFKDIIEKEFENALRRGAKLRMLVIDYHDCVNTKYRAEEIKGGNFDEPIFLSELQQFTNQFISTLDRLAANDPKIASGCEIRVYKDLPCIPMYIVLRKGQLIRGYSSLFLTRATAFFVHFEWTPAKDGMLEELHEYFEQKWNAQVPPRGYTAFPH